MANTFLKKDQDLKNKHKNKSVNSKVELMAQRAAALIEQKNVEINKKDTTVGKEILQKEVSVQEVETVTNTEVKNEAEKVISDKPYTKPKSKKQTPKSNQVLKENRTDYGDINRGNKIPTEEFLNLNIQMDRFEGNTTSVTLGSDLYDKVKEFSEIKNMTLNFFINKMIRVGLEDIDNLTVEDIQKSMLQSLKSRTLPYLLDQEMEKQFESVIDRLKQDGYKISRNTIISAIVSKTINRFYK